MLMSVIQATCGLGYGVAALLLGRGRSGRGAIGLLVAVTAVHAALVLGRAAETGQLPVVSRYEDLTMDALVTALLYLLMQWRWPVLRRAGALAPAFAGFLTVAALSYDSGHFPLGPALQSDWLLIHAQLNSLAIAAASLTASLGILGGAEVDGYGRRLLAWSLWLWAAMVAAGAYWASLAWGRFWGWDPIESWSLGTLLVYAAVLHLRPPAGRDDRWLLRWALVPYGLLLFTTYGLLLVRHSIHGSYLFQ